MEIFNRVVNRAHHLNNRSDSFFLWGFHKSGDNVICPFGLGIKSDIVVKLMPYMYT